MTNIDEQLAFLSPDERRTLAVLAAVGKATLTPEQVGRLADVPGAAAAVERLRALGLVVGEEREGYAAVTALRRTWELAGEAEGVLDNVLTLIEDGRLTRGDVQALLGLAEWAAGAGSWHRLLRLVRAAQLPLEAWRRVEAWQELLDRGEEAARALGDRAAEAWIARERAVASLRSGDLDAAARLLGRGARASTLAGRLAATLIALTLGVGGFLVGLLVVGSAETGTAGTVTVPGETVRETETETATVFVTETQTVVETETETVVETETVTETVTVTVIG